MYDRRGRLVRSVTVTEAEWTEQDQAEIHALALYRSELCRSCGHPTPETTSPEDGGPQYTARKIRCRACDEILRVQDELKNTPRPGALLWRAERKG